MNTAPSARAEQPQPGVAGQASGQAKVFNPDISLNGLFSFSQFNRDNPVFFEEGHDPKGTGFTIQQLEMTFGSAVDPYFRADANLVLTGDGIEIEEAYATSTALPANLQAKVGQFFTAVGRQNPSHPHSWHFVDKPLVLGRFFVGDGLRNPGIQLSWLSPLPWFSELTASAQNSVGETAASFRGEGGAPMRAVSDLLTLVRWSNFFSPSESLGVNVGASYLSGPNPMETTRILGGDLYVHFREVEGLSYLSLEAEALKRYYDTPEAELRDWGWYGQLNYRLPGDLSRWFLGLRYDSVGPKRAPVETVAMLGTEAEPVDPDSARRYRISPVLSYYPSEFSRVRFQYNYDKPEDLDAAQQVFTVQFEFTMGAHGAHKF